MFMANRSNQINSAAQDWGTWKRWALDHKNFDQYKDEVMQTINFHNENATKEVEERIRQAELHNINAIEEVKNSIRQVELHNEKLVKKLQKQETELKEYVSQLVESENLSIARTQNKRNKLTKILIFSLISFSTLIFIGDCSLRYINIRKFSVGRPEHKEF